MTEEYGIQVKRIHKQPDDYVIEAKRICERSGEDGLEWGEPIQ